MDLFGGHGGISCRISWRGGPGFVWDQRIGILSIREAQCRQHLELGPCAGLDVNDMDVLKAFVAVNVDLAVDKCRLEPTVSHAKS